MDSRQHRIWAHTALAWLAMVAIPTLFVTIQWQMGIARDVDIRSVWELIVTFLIVLTLPMGALAFGVYGPLAIGIDRRTAGRTTGVANALIGAALAVPALVVALVLLRRRLGSLRGPAGPPRCVTNAISQDQLNGASFLNVARTHL